MEESSSDILLNKKARKKKVTERHKDDNYHLKGELSL